MIRPNAALYQVICQPLSFVKFYCFQSPLRLGFLCLSIVSIAKIPMWMDDNMSVMSAFLTVFLGYSIILGFQAMATDFFAQLFHFNGKSLTLFAWLNISLLPLMIEPALYLISLNMQLPKLWVSINNLITLIVIFWQIYMIKHIYQSSLRKSLLLYVLPILFLALITCFIGLIGASILSMYD
ncbi:MAG: hypothetical protein VW378_05740 [bacterium]